MLSIIEAFQIIVIIKPNADIHFLSIGCRSDVRHFWKVYLIHLPIIKHFLISLINGIDRLVFIKSHRALLASDFGVSVLKWFWDVVKIRILDSRNVNLIINISVRSVINCWVLPVIKFNYVFIIFCNEFTWLTFDALIAFGFNFNWESVASVVSTFWIDLFIIFFLVRTLFNFFNWVYVCFLVNR